MPAADGELRPHRIAPEAIRAALGQGLDPDPGEIVEPLGRPRRGDDLHPVAFEVETCVDEQLSEQNAGLTRSADAEPLQCAHVAPDRAQVRAYREEPVSVLGQRAQDLAPAPFGKAFERDVGGCTIEVHVTVDKDASWVDGRIDELGVEALRLEETELDRGREREVRGGDNVGDRDAHRIPPSGVFYAKAGRRAHRARSGSIMSPSLRDRRIHADDDGVVRRWCSSSRSKEMIVDRG